MSARAKNRQRVMSARAKNRQRVMAALLAAVAVLGGCAQGATVTPVR